MKHSVLIFVVGLFLAFTAFLPYSLPVLSDKDKAGLLLMREEEKLAQEVYTAMFEKWNHKTFSNIKESEAYHGELVKGLITKYNLQDPYVTEFGKYGNTTLQELYNDFIEKGNKSITDAFEVGAIIEDLDIEDLDKLIAGTKNADLKEVYETLNLGSRNHLRAFVKNLKNSSKNYAPKYISKERFDGIINGQHEICTENASANSKGNAGMACKGNNSKKACAGNGGSKNCGQGMGSNSNKKGCCR